MRIILLTDVKGQGKAGQELNVADGYGRFLIAKGAASVINAQLQNDFAGKAAAAQYRIDQDTAEAQENKAKLDGKTVLMKVKGGESGKLFGAVTAKEDAAAIKAQTGVAVDKKKIAVETIKTFGVYSCTVKLYAGVSATVGITVEKAEE